MNGNRNMWQADVFGHGNAAAWPLPRHGCLARCVEVDRETESANRLRALVARMVEFVPAEHPLTAEARAVLE